MVSFHLKTLAFLLCFLLPLQFEINCTEADWGTSMWKIPPYLFAQLLKFHLTVLYQTKSWKILLCSFKLIRKSIRQYSCHNIPCSNGSVPWLYFLDVVVINLPSLEYCKALWLRNVVPIIWSLMNLWALKSLIMPQGINWSNH